MKVGVKMQYQLDRAKRLGVTVPDDQLRWGPEHVRGWLDAEETQRAAKLMRPFCKVCGWRKGGPDSWDGNACKCGHTEPPMQQ